MIKLSIEPQIVVMRNGKTVELDQHRVWEVLDDGSRRIFGYLSHNPTIAFMLVAHPTSEQLIDALGQCEKFCGRKVLPPYEITIPEIDNSKGEDEND